MPFKQNFLKPKLMAGAFLPLGSILVVAIFAVGAAWFIFQRWLVTPLAVPVEGYNYELEKGKSISYLAHDLATQNLLNHPRWLGWYAQFKHKEKIHTGEYFLHSGITPLELLDKLNNGDVILHQVTFVEGWNFRQVLAALNENAEVTHLLTNKTTAEQLALLNLPISHPEGWFYPDTYLFTKGATDVELLTQAYNSMRKNLDQAWAERAKDLPYSNAYEALIMASIIERETGSASERQQIAGVFVRRLQQGMKLQTDPTVIYGMGENYRGKITKDDLIQATAYNTYVIEGLPPTPIAIPGKASIHAALHPDSGSALYFVAKGDGTSEFSDTLVDHQRATAKYQLQRREDYRSTPK